jgi:hypothetical protein
MESRRPGLGGQLARLGPRNVKNGAKVAGCYATGIRQHHRGDSSQGSLWELGERVW